MYSLLCLGDSYTIGEGLPLYDCFPYQTLQLLRKAGHAFYAPEIIARTGWSTDELAFSMSHRQLLPRYDFVSLLIGVNNQYRGRDVKEYSGQFELLLQQSIRLAGDDPARVHVLSIPDWSTSPFAAGSGRDLAAITAAIDEFNQAARAITRRRGPSFIDITSHGREAGTSPHHFTTDGLHPSAEQYHFWARQLADAISSTLGTADLPV